MPDWSVAELVEKSWPAVLTACIGWVSGAYARGRKHAIQEAKVKEDYTGLVNKLEEKVSARMEAGKQSADSRNDLLVEQFKESFDGIRRQIDEVRLSTEREFLRKDDFREFREEYREDQRRIMDKLDRLTAN